MLKWHKIDENQLKVIKLLIEELEENIKNDQEIGQAIAYKVQLLNVCRTGKYSDRDAELLNLMVQQRRQKK